MASILNSVRDTTWLRNAVLAKTAKAKMLDARASTFTTADLKFTDTRLGGNFCINPLPQFTRYADIKRRGLAVDGAGMGRYHSEAFDDHYQIIHLRMGIPTFNSLAFFIGSFYDAQAGLAARTGRASSFFFTLGNAAGWVVSVMSWKLQALAMLGKAFLFFTETSTSKFYTVKPTMPLYWTSVQNIMSQLSVNLGLIPRAFGNDPVGGGPNQGYQFGERERKIMNEAMPSTFFNSGNIDVFAVAGRAQRLARKQMRAFENANAATTTVASALNAAYFAGEGVSENETMPSYQAYINKWLKSSGTTPGDAKAQTLETIDTLAAGKESFGDFLEAELDDGGAFASFRVNYTGSVSESFSNQTGESEIASKFANLSSSGRNLTFNLAGGNLFPGAGAVVEAITSFATGALGSVGLSGVVAALSGGAVVDIPQQWKSSMANLTKSTYTIDLVTPYNHPMAQLMYIYLPMAMLMAAALPRATGKQSYTSPFVLEYYDKGRTQSRLGMFDSLSFTRGIHNLGFNKDQRAMGVRATFSIADMTGMMSIPLSQGSSLGEAVLAGAIGSPMAVVNKLTDGFFDDHNAYSDYMASLASLGLADQIYRSRKFKLNATREMVRWESWTSPSRWAAVMADTLPGRLVSAFYTGTARE